MNVALPESQYLIATLGEVSVAGLVAFRIGLLDGPNQFGVQSRVSMPEIAVPLDNDPDIREQYVNDEFPGNDLLLLKYKAESVQNCFTSPFQAVRALPRGKAKFVRNPLEVSGVIPACMAAILHPNLQSPSRHVKSFATGDAALDFSSSPDSDGSLSSCFSASRAILPCVSADKRAETDSAVTARVERLPAPTADVRTTGVATLGHIGARRVLLATLQTNG
jgi:hypothetical protein